MDLTNERQLAARAAALGESADAGAMPELAALTRSPSALVRRLAASALGKLAGIVPPAEAVTTLLPLLRDPHPQCRQYAAKALGAFGTQAASALPDLRDLYRNQAEKDYVKRSVLAAGKTIREAVRIAERQVVRVCQHCGTTVAPDEYARRQRHFQRTYCDRCFDETFAKRRNFDTTVEDHKTVRAADGTFVQSQGERRIAEWLAARGIAYRYDERFRILDGYALHPDFSPRKVTVLLAQLPLLRAALEGRVADVFLKRLPTGHRTRLWPEFGRDMGFLDVETTGLGRRDEITVIALHVGGVLHQFVRGRNLEEFLRVWRQVETLVTFNGAAFDLPHLTRTFGLTATPPHLDLRAESRAHGLAGGLKEIERQLGIVRAESEDGNGALAAEWWARHVQHNDAGALDRLLRYNVRDTLSLLHLTEYLWRRSMEGYPEPLASLSLTSPPSAVPLAL